MDLNCKIVLELIGFSFMTFKSCPHLDGKHSVFGKLTPESLSFLDRVETLAVDSRDKPLEDITVDDVEVITNPYRDTIAEILLKEWKKKSGDQRAKNDVKWTALSGFKKTEEKNAGVETIGKYIKSSATSTALQTSEVIKR